VTEESEMRTIAQVAVVAVVAVAAVLLYVRVRERFPQLPGLLPTGPPNRF